MPQALVLGTDSCESFGLSANVCVVFCFLVFVFMCLCSGQKEAFFMCLTAIIRAARQMSNIHNTIRDSLELILLNFPAVFDFCSLLQYMKLTGFHILFYGSWKRFITLS